MIRAALEKLRKVDPTESALPVPPHTHAFRSVPLEELVSFPGSEACGDCGRDTPNFESGEQIAMPAVQKFYEPV